MNNNKGSLDMFPLDFFDEKESPENGINYKKSNESGTGSRVKECKEKKCGENNLDNKPFRTCYVNNCKSNNNRE